MKKKLLPFQVIIIVALLLTILNLIFLLIPLPVHVHLEFRVAQIFLNILIILLCSYIMIFYDIV